MKPTAYILSLLLATVSGTALANDTADSAKPGPAEKPAPKLITGLPKYSPPAPVEAKPLDTPADPDVLELPKMVIKQKPRPRLTPEVVFTKNAFGEELAKKKFSALDQALNKFNLPLFGTSLADRALEEHEREKNEQMNKDVATIATALEQSDPAEAKALREAAAKR